MLLACKKNKMQRPDSPNKKELSPEKVRRVAEKVYAMFLKDIKIAKERSGHTYKTSRVNRTSTHKLTN